MTRGQLVASLALAAAFAFVVAASWSRALGPQDLERAVAQAQVFATAHPFAAPIVFVVAYLVFAGLAVPGVWVLSVVGGALYGPWLGAPLVAGSSAIAATFAMMAARFLFRDAIVARYPKIVARLDVGGARYLLAARLAPFIPYALVNLAAGATRMPAPTFLIVSLIGSLPLAYVYGLAGNRFSSLSDSGDLLGPRALALLLALALAPFVARALADRAMRRA